MDLHAAEPQGLRARDLSGKIREILVHPGEADRAEPARTGILREGGDGIVDLRDLMRVCGHGEQQVSADAVRLGLRFQIRIRPFSEDVEVVG